VASTYKGNRACNCHCCPAYTAFDPSQLNPAHVSYVGTSDPAEVSDGHARAVIYERVTESALTTENVIEGAATGTVTVASDPRGADHPGGRRITIDVTTTDNPWVAGVILWDDSGYTYDPNAKGSISRIRAALAVRWYNETNILAQPTAGQPWPLFGVAIEQGGETFVSYEHDLNALRDDECWTTRSGGAFDGSGAQYVGRLPYNGDESDGTGAIPVRNDGAFRLGRCDDRLVKIGSNGEFELGTEGSRPDISYDSAVSRPVTKFGIFIGLMSEAASVDYAASGNSRAAAGDYVYDILVDDLWLDVASWGVPKVFDADVGNAPDFGTTYVDEDLTSIPAWTASGAAVTLPGGGGDESCAGGGGAALIDGQVGNQTTFGGEYTALRMSTSPTVPAVSDSGTVTVEFEWLTIDERDHVKPTGEADDPDLSRRLWSGVWIADACRFLATKEGDMWDHGCGNMRWEMQGYIYADGGRKSVFPVASTYGGDDYNYSTNEKYSGRANGHNCGGDLQRKRAAPMDGDRVVIMLRRQYTDAEAAALNAQYIQNVSDGVYDQPPSHSAYPEARWFAYVWIHGRLLLMGFESLGGFDLGETAGSFLWFGGSGGGALTVGLLGMCGGHWKDFRLKVRA
jgi:hypothetical protein